MLRDLGKRPKPTERQMRIITDNNFPRYLTAGPGTGKTEVLINKIVHLLKNASGEDMPKFVIITYTNKATDEMRSRLSSRINSENLALSKNMNDALEISTIHSFCYRLLKKYGAEIGFSPELQIKSYTQELSDVVEAVFSRANEPLLSRIADYRLKNIIKDILKECYTHGIAPNMRYVKYSKSDDRLWTEIEGAIMRLCIDAYNEVERMKIRDNALTLNDLITMTQKLLENAQVVKSIASEYTYLFIDEFQDTNQSQLDIVRILINAGVNVFLIGDEKQSIYAFRGADIECSKQAKVTISERHSLDDFEINENFRTDYALLMQINDVFNRPFMYKDKRLSFPQAPLAKTEELQAAKAANDNAFRMTYGEEVYDIVKGLIKEPLHERKINYEDIFILCRTNYEVRQISGKLKRNGVPCIHNGQTDKSDISDYLKESADNSSGYVADTEEVSDGVNILTIHKAKGLSLPIVIIPNIDRNLLRKRELPDYIIDKNEKTFALANVTQRITASRKYLRLLDEKTMRHLEEELRVLYVAMTRVEHVLVMANQSSKDEIQKAQKDEEKITWNDWVGESAYDSKLQRFYRSVARVGFFNGRR